MLSMLAKTNKMEELVNTEYILSKAIAPYFIEMNIGEEMSQEFMEMGQML